jgi:hypothetical protein
LATHSKKYLKTSKGEIFGRYSQKKTAKYTFLCLGLLFQTSVQSLCFDLFVFFLKKMHSYYVFSKIIVPCRLM